MSSRPTPEQYRRVKQWVERWESKAWVEYQARPNNCIDSVSFRAMSTWIKVISRWLA